MISHCAGAEGNASRAWSRRLAPFAALIALLACFGAEPAAAKGKHPSKHGFMVIDAASGERLRSARSRTLRQPASLTKMMTVYLAFEALRDRKLRLSQRLRVSRHAAGMPASRLGLKAGSTIRVSDAIRAAAIKSANDAAVVLAEAIGGTERAFAQMMTRKAREMGMRDTRFRNATGLTQLDHYSTAADMAILARRLWRDFPKRYKVFSRRSAKVRGRRIRNTNRLLGVSEGVDGVKTGYTRRAGYNLAASARRDGDRVIAVYMSGRSRVGRDRAVRRLLDDGFKRLRRLKASRRDGGGAVRRAPPPAPRPGALRPVASAGVAPRRAPPPAAQGDPPARARGVETASLAASVRARPARSVIRGWAVQVGAYVRQRDATHQMSRIIAMDAPGLRSGFRQLKTVGVGDARRRRQTIYRVRFAGLAERDARRACAYLEAKGSPCALVPPAGWGRR